MQQSKLLLAALVSVLCHLLFCLPSQAEFPESSADWIAHYGHPDLFISVFGNGAVSKSEREKQLQFWVYCKQGIEILLENGKLFRIYIFDPRDGKLISSSSRYRPEDFSASTTFQNIIGRLGKPDEQNEETFLNHKLVTLRYQKERLELNFIDGKLSAISSGISGNDKNPFCEFRGRTSSPDQLQDILGTWNSNFGPVTFKRSSTNPQFFDGYWNEKSKFGGVIKLGNYDRSHGFLQFSVHQKYNNSDGHAEFLSSSDGKRLEGSLHCRRQCRLWYLWR